MMVTVLGTFKGLNNVNTVIKTLVKLSLSKNPYSSCTPVQKIPAIHRYALIHTTSRKYDLMEFFDDKKNWDKTTVKVGRSWKKDELRIKSNEDLHKLWYILLKEKNMLLTMEHRANELEVIFPNPERYDKVVKSMQNLELVVRERNEAYFQLETGQSGEQPALYINNVLGMRQYYKFRQYIKPKHGNTIWKHKHKFGYNGYAVRKFLRLYREKLWNQKRKNRNQQTNKAIALIKKFPNLDLLALKQKYSLVDINKLIRNNKLKSLRLKSLVD